MGFAVSAPGRTVKVAGVLALMGLLAGCGPRMDLGSDVWWVSLFESGTFEEWTGTPGGSANAVRTPPNTIQVSGDNAHHGHYAAELAIDAEPAGPQQNTGLVRRGDLPIEAYYSAWYYLPHTAAVGGFWVLFKFRLRTDAANPTSDAELYDLRLVNAPDGSLTLSIYDHRSLEDLPLLFAAAVPVRAWFQIEAFYRNAQDETGRLVVWLNGQKVVEVAGQPMAPTPWVEWDVVNVGQNLTPPTAVVMIDDCAISFSRVGPTGVISE